MAKKGVCQNIECQNYRKVIEVENGVEMKCPLCGQPLRIDDGKKRGSDSGNLKKVVMSVIAAAVFAGGGYGIYASLSSDEQSDTNTTTEAVPVPEPVQEAEPVQEEPETEVNPIQEDNAVQIKNGRGVVDLGYASYKGDLKNGKPHGYGILTYKKTTKIVPSKDFVASPGDTFEGDFRDGRISNLGYWKHNGNTTAVKP